MSCTSARMFLHCSLSVSFYTFCQSKIDRFIQVKTLTTDQKLFKPYVYSRTYGISPRSFFYIGDQSDVYDGFAHYCVRQVVQQRIINGKTALCSLYQRSHNIFGRIVYVLAAYRNTMRLTRPAKPKASVCTLVILEYIYRIGPGRCSVTKVVVFYGHPYLSLSLSFPLQFR